VHIALTQHAFGGERRLSSFKVQYDKIRNDKHAGRHAHSILITA
jgi:hypothetical protein